MEKVGGRVTLKTLQYYYTHRKKHLPLFFWLHTAPLTCSSERSGLCLVTDYYEKYSERMMRTCTRAGKDKVLTSSYFGQADSHMWGRSPPLLIEEILIFSREEQIHCPARCNQADRRFPCLLKSFSWCNHTILLLFQHCSYCFQLPKIMLA